MNRPTEPSADGDDLLLDQVERFWPLDGWNVQRLEQPRCIAARYAGDSGEWLVYALTEETERILAAYSLFPRVCPEVRRTAMLELLARANDDLVLGNFEYSFDNDEIRCKTSVNLGDAGLTQLAWRSLVAANVLLMDRYFVAIDSVIEGKSEPEEAVQSVEGG
jgi:hypothetical protein